MMIDWLTLCVYLDQTQPYRELPCKRGAVLTPDGELEELRDLKLPVEGSYSNRVVVWRGDGKLWISGNPAKWYQGHNLFGSGDCRSMAVDIAQTVIERVGFPLTRQERAMMAAGFLGLTRVDVNTMFDFGTQQEVRAVLRHMGVHATAGHRRQATFLGGSVYFGVGSRRMSAKAYSKGEELRAGKKHQLPEVFSDTDRRRLLDYADGSLRFELCIRGMELSRLSLAHASMWSVETGRELLDKFLEGVTMPKNVELGALAVEGLPAYLRKTYALWFAGEDVSRYYARMTFYRHRKALLGFGVDILTPPAGVEFNELPPVNVVPFVRRLEGRELGVPDWAKGTALYYEPKSAAR